MKKLKGDAITYTLESSDRVLLHCCNAQGAYGRGIAKQIRDRVPQAYQAYRDSGYRLGTISVAGQVINMVAQEFYGTGQRQVDYGYLAKCLASVSVNEYGEVVIPNGMCCGLAGGDWGITLEICKAFIGEDKLTVVEYGR